MVYFISFLVVIKDLSANSTTVKHFYNFHKDCSKDAIDYVKDLFPDAVDISEKICGDDECTEKSCHCDKSIFY